MAVVALVAAMTPAGLHAALAAAAGRRRGGVDGPARLPHRRGPAAADAGGLPAAVPAQLRRRGPRRGRGRRGRPARRTVPRRGRVQPAAAAAAGHAGRRTGGRRRAARRRAWRRGGCRTTTSTGSTPRWSCRRSTRTGGGCGSTGSWTRRSRSATATCSTGRITEDWVTICCVSNPVGGDLIGNAWWSGVRIADLLREAGVRPEADAVKQTSQDGWTCGTPIEALTDGRNAMLAVAMNGEPLPVEHGFPVRMIVPGLYGFVSATKWVVDLEVTKFSDFSAFWTERGWSSLGPVKTESRVEVPRDGGDVQHRLRAGRRARVGAAHRDREGGVPPRRRPLAGGRARPGPRQRHLGAVGPARSRSARATTGSRSGPPTGPATRRRRCAPTWYRTARPAGTAWASPPAERSVTRDFTGAQVWARAQRGRPVLSLLSATTLGQRRRWKMGVLVATDTATAHLARTNPSSRDTSVSSGCCSPAWARSSAPAGCSARWTRRPPPARQRSSPGPSAA